MRDDLAECGEWIRRHSRSFYLSSLLLPRRVREAAWALYAFCRRADDAVDEHGRGVDEFRRILDGIYQNAASHNNSAVDAGNAGDAASSAVDRAFARVVERYRIPRALPDALLDGLAEDARGPRFAGERELYAYCFRVASTVGLMMTCVMGCSSDVAYLRAADLGLAMQLTNIARDVGEDARRGRLYLPGSWCAELGLDPATLDSPSEPARAAVRRLLALAGAHYRAADLGIPLLPRACRPAIAASRRIYAAIGDEIARADYDTITRRARVSTARKLALAALATTTFLSRPPPRDATGPADEELRRLLEEVGM